MSGTEEATGGTARQRALEKADEHIEAGVNDFKHFRHRRDVGPILDIVENIERDIIALVPAEHRSKVQAVFVQAQPTLLAAMLAALDSSFRSGAEGSATAGTDAAADKAAERHRNQGALWRERALNKAREYIEQEREAGNPDPTVPEIAKKIHKDAQKAGRSHGVEVAQIRRWLNAAIKGGNLDIKLLQQQ